LIYLAEELVVPTFDDGATPPQVSVNEDLESGETIAYFKAATGNPPFLYDNTNYRV